MTDMQAEKVAESVRQAFEHWFSDEGKHPNAVQRQGDGYILASAHIAWSAWQVAYTSLLTKLQAERDEALVSLDFAAKGEAEYTRKWTLAEARAEALQAENERLKANREVIVLGNPDFVGALEKIRDMRGNGNIIVPTATLGDAISIADRALSASSYREGTHEEALRARISELEKALEPFAGDKMPSLKRSAIDYDRNGLRRLISPMEIAMRDARNTLKGGEK